MLKRFKKAIKFFAADKSKNIYLVSKDEYQKLLTEINQSINQLINQ